jgi:hypothetical protein
VPARAIFPEVPSQRFFSLVDSWLKTCKDCHACRIDTDRELPTRVINVGDENQDPFLFESHGTYGRWVTLSHCWGKEQPLKTELGTLKDRCAKMPFHTMPPMFQDAIIITRRLGHQYLWIDCLCIIQDCFEDWKRESTNMGKIYKSCTLTIAADEAQDSYSGIFESSNKGRESVLADQCMVQVSCHMQRNTQRVKGQIFCGPSPKRTARALGPLNHRAWTLQETLLSPRVLRFAKERVWWECQEMQKDEVFPFQHTKSARNWDPLQLKRIMKDSLEPLRYTDEALRLWRQLVNRFALRSITFCEDKFPAISAAAKEVQRHLGQEYKAGIWLEDMHFGLAWSTFGPGATRTPTYVAPSWSWASVNFDKIKGDGFRGIYKYEFFRRAEPLDRALIARIVDVNVENIDHDSFSRVTSGSLVIRGPYLNVCRCNVPITFLDFHDHSSEDPVTRLTAGGYKFGDRIRYSRTPGGQCWNWGAVSKLLCTGDKRLLHEEVAYLHISNMHVREDPSFALALILQPAGLENSDTYRRIGLAQLIRDKTSDDPQLELWPTREVTII